jgi:undecaprenyl-diphosphatase
MSVDGEIFTQWAVWVGQRAQPLFFVLLALLLAATCACWWLLRRTTEARRQQSISPTLFVGLRIMIGLAITLAGAGVFALLARQIGAGEALSRADQALTDALRVSMPRTALQVFAALTHLADTATLTGLCIVMALALITLGRRWLALGWVVALAGNGLLNQTLKQIFSRVRPLHPDSLVLAQGFSFPSGHSSGALVACGMLAYLALRLLPERWHLPTLVAAVALAFTVGASRLFLSVHFASDVVAGFASGTAWLALCVTSIELIRWLRQRTD